MISLRSLRERLARVESFPPAWTDEHPTPEETRALVDAVTAAREYRGLVAPRLDRIEEEAAEKLDAKLARFDFDAES